MFDNSQQNEIHSVNPLKYFTNTNATSTISGASKTNPLGINAVANIKLTPSGTATCIYSCETE